MQDVHDPAQSIRLGVVTNFDRHGVLEWWRSTARAPIWIIGAAFPIQGQVGGKIPQAVAAVALPG